MKVRVKFVPNDKGTITTYRKTFKSKEEYRAFEEGIAFANGHDSEDGVWTVKEIPDEKENCSRSDESKGR